MNTIEAGPVVLTDSNKPESDSIEDSGTTTTNNYTRVSKTLTELQTEYRVEIGDENGWVVGSTWLSLEGAKDQINMFVGPGRYRIIRVKTSRTYCKIGNDICK